MVGYRSAHLAVVAALVVAGAVPATAASAAPLPSAAPATTSAQSSSRQDAAAQVPAPVQLLPLTSAAGQATDLAQAEPGASTGAAQADAGTSQGAALRPDLASAVAALTRVDPERDASLLTEPMEVSDFLVAGFTWSGTRELPTGTRIYLRVREDGIWSPWYESEAAQDGPDDGRGRPGTTELVTSGADAVQAAVVTSAPLPSDLTLALVPGEPEGQTTLGEDDVTATQAPATPVEAADGAAASAAPGSSQGMDAAGGAGAAGERTQPAESGSSVPAGTSAGSAVAPAAPALLAAATTAHGLPVPVTTRAEWGAQGHGDWDLEYASAQHVVVHHTAGSNDYTADQSAGIVKGIYHYHAVTLDWGDIGYNFLVDKYGQVFEGRDGTLAAGAGKMVVAGHALGVNTGTMGISMIGNFSSVAPSQAQLDAVGKIAGWFLGRAGVSDVSSTAGLRIGITTKYAKGQTVDLPHVFGHRDVNYTECPGNTGYTFLAAIREAAQTEDDREHGHGDGGNGEDGDTSSAPVWVKDGATWYLNDASGTHLTGWQYVGGRWYFLDRSSGAMRTGWVQDKGTWYYLLDWGAMDTGWALVGGRWYFLDRSSGAMRTSWVQDRSAWYYLASSGAMDTGWAQVDGRWYFLDRSSGAMRTGWVEDGSARYYLASSGAMDTGWALVGGRWYFLDRSSGAMRTGWLDDGASRYYLDPSSGAMATGARTVDGTTYYFTTSGALGKGWSRVGADWYYIGADGVPATGWERLGSTWYYLKPDYAMVVGWAKINGAWYYFDSSGAMVTGWARIGGTWYYMDASGAMRTGWLTQSGRWYYLTGSGAMATGWLRLGTTWYHFDEQGVMATGTDYVDGKYQVFDANGAWQYASEKAPATSAQHSIMARPTASQSQVVSAMVKAYQSSGATYPAAQLGKGGASTINQFAQIVYQEATDEGVSPELVFVQAMKETGWLRFGGAVSVSQFNFAGIGATGGGAAGASFQSVREGIRAQVQHLRAYADASVTAARLAHPVVDPRFSYVRKGAAATVEYLGIQENPQHTGWASAKGYGVSLAELIETYF